MNPKTNKGYEAAKESLLRKVKIPCLGGCGQIVEHIYIGATQGKYCPTCRRETELIREHNRQRTKSAQQREKYWANKEFRETKRTTERERQRKRRREIQVQNEAVRASGESSEEAINSTVQDGGRCAVHGNGVWED